MKVLDLFEARTEFNANIDDAEFNDIVEMLGQCGPWLNDYGFETVLFRGRWGIEQKYKIANIRQDRIPRSLSPMLQAIVVDYIDTAAKDQGVRSGVANRQNSAFCYKDPSDASTYGVPYAFFPMGEYRTTYLKGVHDLFSTHDEGGIGEELAKLSYKIRDGSGDDDDKKSAIAQITEWFDQKQIVFDDISTVANEEILVRAVKGLYINKKVFDNIKQDLIKAVGHR